MKYCGCNSCRKNGEVNPLEEFELFLKTKEQFLEQEFSDILCNSFSAAELNDLEAEFNSSDVVNRINQHTAKPIDARNYWASYGGSLGAFERMQKGIELNED